MAAKTHEKSGRGEEVGVSLEAASSSPFYPVYYTALHTGLRQAELCALTWRDIDLKNLSLSVNKTLYKRRGQCYTAPPKSKNSNRQIRLTANLAAYLEEYRGERESLYLHLSRLLSLDDYVFGTLNKPCDPSMLSHDFAIIARKARLEKVRFHDLRHTFASLALDRGAPAKVVSEMLGHASVAFTLQTYAHVLSSGQEKTVELLNDVLPEGVKKPTGTFLTP